jgi:hypothetical protein
LHCVVIANPHGVNHEIALRQDLPDGRENSFKLFSTVLWTPNCFSEIREHIEAKSESDTHGHRKDGLGGYRQERGDCAIGRYL